MLQKIIVWFIQFSPSTKRWFWKKWYTVFANRAQNPDFKFMNYGFSEDGFFPELHTEDELERYPIHLYHHVVSQINVTGKTILEIGSGRGGGASYVSRYLKPSSVVGMDISESAVELCQSIHSVDTLSFSVGDSENIPFDDHSFDVVLNVESSHCYGNVDQFLSEVNRVLKPGGHFLWCDLRPSDGQDDVFNQFEKAGFSLLQKCDITSNILSALSQMTESRKKAIRETVPRFIQNVFESYAGVEGSKVYDSFQDGSLVYLSAALSKKK
ncbi:MAG: class I SAM-dependent methyltransferase [Candidatus Marinimicrobia bacterium]|nr:class I SAM-dependent methyltransferase [Candidatus Neomarinimicrobiota bacterium]